MYQIYGIASGNGADIYGSQLGVWNVYYQLKHLSLKINNVFYTDSINTKLNVIPDIKYIFDQISNYPHNDKTIDKYLFFTGDHSNAIPVWSYINNVKNTPIGLIWVDSHLDCHTPITSHSKNVHGMPVSHLMGHGDTRLSSLIKDKIKPENFCYIGAKYYESEELEFVKKHNIKTFFMEDITSSNLNDVFSLAVEHVTRDAEYFGVSFDIDSLSNSVAPGTGCYNSEGLDLPGVIHNLKMISQNKKFTGIEVTEYNPLLDIDNKTLKIILEIVRSII